MTEYSSPYCDAHFVERDLCWSDMGEALFPQARDLFSPASLDALEGVLDVWIEKPGTLSARLNVSNSDIQIFVESIPRGGDCAVLSVPVADLVLAAATHCMDHEGVPVTDLSAMLRKLADEVDALGSQEDRNG